MAKLTAEYVKELMESSADWSRSARTLNEAMIEKLKAVLPEGSESLIDDLNHSFDFTFECGRKCGVAQKTISDFES